VGDGRGLEKGVSLTEVSSFIPAAGKRPVVYEECKPRAKEGPATPDESLINAGGDIAADKSLVAACLSAFASSPSSDKSL
jgi:hypothetical protein